VQGLKKFNRELEIANRDAGIAEKKYRSIFENAIEGIFQITLQGRLLNANPAAAAIMGFSTPAEMLLEIGRIEDRLLVSHMDLCRFLLRIQSHGSVTGHEIQVKRKDNTTIWLSVNVRLIQGEVGNEPYIDGIMEDITVRKHADKQLQRYREHLEQLVSERTKEYQDINADLQREIQERERVEEELLRSRKLESIGLLAGGIAHDFNNLLTVIMGSISLAQSRSGQNNTPELDNALQALYRAKDLTHKFTTFSSGGDPIKVAHNIEEVTRSAVEFALSGSNIRPIFSIAPDLPRVNIDQGYIGQAMYNILENSKQVMKKGGTLRVTIQKLIGAGESLSTNLPVVEGAYVAVDFEDSGCGIVPEHLSKIFDPYFTTAEMGAQKGKGLGLTITHSIIKKHGGYTFVDSTVGKGTRLRLLLPALRDS
jgi:PAS domain S-box-containing protein